MTRRALPAFTLALAAPVMLSAGDPGDLDGMELAQVTIRERIVIRIPRLAPGGEPAARAYAPAPPPARSAWREKSAPRCVPAAAIAGAAISPDGDVDLVGTDGRRMRAKLDDDCPTLNFYRGFYLKRPADGMICAKRDALRSRSGARCEISGFRTLVARR